VNITEEVGFINLKRLNKAETEQKDGGFKDTFLIGL
jgi:hypothetical protein